MRAPPLASPAALTTLAALAALAAALAACGGGASSVRRGAGGAGGLDVGVAFAPSERGAAALTALAVPLEKARSLIDTVPEDERGDYGRSGGAGSGEGNGEAGDEATGEGGGEPGDAKPAAYDLDRDGAVDLVVFPEVMYGPSQGWLAYAAEGGKLRKLFGISGDWADVRVEAGAVTLRFQANALAPGEAVFSTTIRYANRAWDPPIKSYASAQGKIPTPRPPYGSFTTRRPTVLRARPEVDDKAKPKTEDGEEPDEEFGGTATLRGNVLASYGPGARGTVLATEGAWRYVAFDPAIKPAETSLAHGMDDTAPVEGAPEAAPRSLQSDAWLCGWAATADLDVKE
jgi:hypothetical protein